ncbi:MAG: ammonium transporter, partial [Pseudomonadota bacterium]
MLSERETLWLITATFLVLLMQCGFLLLEGGRVRAKNSINVAQKNVTDLIVSWAMFFIVGFFVMFGVAPPLGDAAAPTAMGLSPLHFLFHMAFCATAASIVSGGVAERMSFRGYLVVTILISALVYPLAGRLTWGDAYDPANIAWLAELGFIDFAGATVVHGVGAACALACAIILGPRLGRFDDQGRALPMPAYNSVLSLAGVLILMIGWLGFNGGGLAPDDPRLAGVMTNTMTAAAFGGLAGLIVGAMLDRGTFLPSRTCNGIIGGLVAITACAHLASTMDAAMLGIVGGAVACFGAEWLLTRARIDDPVDVVATHGLAGIAGTLGLALVAPLDALPAGGRLAQLGVQAFGSACILGLTAAATGVTLKVFARFAGVRVSPDAEIVGLNLSEHGEGTGTDRLQRILADRVEQFGKVDTPIEIDANDEHSELAGVMSRLMQKYDDAKQCLDASEQRFRQFAGTASDWLFETDIHLNVTYFNGARSVSADRSLTPLLDLLGVSEDQRAHVASCLEARTATGTFEAAIRMGPDADGERAVEVR